MSKKDTTNIRGRYEKIISEAENKIRRKYRRILFRNHVLIPCCFFLIAFLSLQKPHRVISLISVTMVISAVTLGLMLLAHYCERIKGDACSVDDHEKATFTMQMIMYFCAAFTAIAIAIIILFG